MNHGFTALSRDEINFGLQQLLYRTRWIYIWLYSKARYQAEPIGYNQLRVERGQILTNIRLIAESNPEQGRIPSKSVIAHDLTALEEARFITRKSLGQPGTLITICSYGVYTSVSDLIGTQAELWQNAGRTQAERLYIENNKEKKTNYAHEDAKNDPQKTAPSATICASPLPAGLADDSDRWDRALTALANSIDSENFATWIATATYLGHAPDALYLEAPSDFNRSWLTRNYEDTILRAFGFESGRAELNCRVAIDYSAKGEDAAE